MKRFLVFLLVAGLIFVAVGFWQGWFTASSSNANGESGFSISFHGDELKGDWDKATDKIGEVATSAWVKVKDLVSKDDDGKSTLEGKVVSVDSDNHTLTIETDGKQVEIPMLVTARLENLDTLVGKNVKLGLEEKDGAVVIRSIAVK